MDLNQTAWPAETEGLLALACSRKGHRLETSRLLIQSASLGDLAVITATGSDPESQRWLGWPPSIVLSDKVRRELLDRRPDEGRPAESRTMVQLAIIERDEDRIVGGISLYRHFGRITVGYNLAPHWQGRGFATEALMAVTAFAHEHLGITTITAGAEPDNLASTAVLTKAGYRALLRPALTHQLPDGRTVPAAWFEHTDDAIAACRHRRRLPIAG